MQRRATKNTRGPNAIEKAFQKWLKESAGCVITGSPMVEVHHCKGSTFKHNKVLIGHMFCLPLHPKVHKEYDKGSKPWIAKYGKQSELWAEVYARFIKATGADMDWEIVEAIKDYGRTEYTPPVDDNVFLTPEYSYA